MKTLLLLILISSCTHETSPLVCTVTNIHHNTCYGSPIASMTITATGGVQPYEYRLDSFNYQSSNTFQNIPSGSHKATAKDLSGNTASEGFIIVGVGSPECK